MRIGWFESIAEDDTATGWGIEASRVLATGFAEEARFRLPGMTATEQLDMKIIRKLSQFQKLPQIQQQDIGARTICIYARRVNSLEENLTPFRGM
jgi:hypothetical protein